MRRILIVTVACAVLISLPSALEALPAGLHVRTYKGNLDFPIDMAWVKGTRKIFFTEKNTGKVRVMRGQHLLDTPCRNLSVSSSGESGALGIALHPNFSNNHWLYVYYTNDSPLENRVSRFTVRHNKCRDQKAILRGIRASSGYHNGGQLEFVGGKLFVSVGESHDAAQAQQKGNRLGKILRLNADGTVPNGNPFGANNPVWTYGHRNPFGLAHKPGTRILFETENGPNCDDELNVIKKGRNYGWGAAYLCGTSGVGLNPKPPIFRWSDVVVPTDPVFYKGRLGRLSGRLYVGDFSQGRLHRFALNSTGTNVRHHSIIYNGDGIVDVAKGPGGWLYLLTSSAIKQIRR